MEQIYLADILPAQISVTGL